MLGSTRHPQISLDGRAPANRAPNRAATPAIHDCEIDFVPNEEAKRVVLFDRVVPASCRERVCHLKLLGGMQSGIDRPQDGLKLIDYGDGTAVSAHAP